MSQFRDEEENPNRFSDLPQEVTCEILGYLDIQDIARASTLSKEFNKLCTLLPRLCIDSEQIGDDPNKREDFFEFLNCHTEKVLEEKSLRCVNLRWKLSATRENYVFGRFIRKAAASDNVKEMDVDIISNIIFICRCINIRIYIPHCCPSLEKLKLKGDIEFNPISTNSILNLQELVLNGVGVVSDLFVKWLPESCKNLKLLSVRDIVGVKNLTIACPISLRFLAILGAYDSVNVEAESLSGLIIYLPVGTKTMRIFAPNLNILELEGCIAENYYLGNFKFLEIARLYYQWHLNTEEELIRFRPKIDELIQSVSQTKTLYVGENILQVRIYIFLVFNFYRG
uniref:F-box/FBD/LRR-repeat protein At2g04230-like n=1 Tax=Fragaria vesca subsp. vesca TaxID=101020 RepID=UPI0005CA2D75|nr:PREDICTED: F-box/FBD/LRR-repeat protein At2g04230-like [Fragaria vesca subsp. vesca]